MSWHRADSYRRLKELLKKQQIVAPSTESTAAGFKVFYAQYKRWARAGARIAELKRVCGVDP